MNNDYGNELIVTIVKRGWSHTVVDAARKAGAEGATILFGRGSGINEVKTLLGITIEPERDYFTVVGASGQMRCSCDPRCRRTDRPGMGMALSSRSGVKRWVICFAKWVANKPVKSAIFSGSIRKDHQTRKSGFDSPTAITLTVKGGF